jgi:hypothetical protein
MFANRIIAQNTHYPTYQVNYALTHEFTGTEVVTVMMMCVCSGQKRYDIYSNLSSSTE